jgi:hypothetical protein
MTTIPAVGTAEHTKKFGDMFVDPSTGNFIPLNLSPERLGSMLQNASQSELETLSGAKSADVQNAVYSELQRRGIEAKEQNKKIDAQGQVVQEPQPPTNIFPSMVEEANPMASFNLIEPTAEPMIEAPATANLPGMKYVVDKVAPNNGFHDPFSVEKHLSSVDKLNTEAKQIENIKTVLSQPGDPSKKAAVAREMFKMKPTPRTIAEMYIDQQVDGSVRPRIVEAVDANIVREQSNYVAAVALGNKTGNLTEVLSMPVSENEVGLAPKYKPRDIRSGFNAKGILHDDYSESRDAIRNSEFYKKYIAKSDKNLADYIDFISMVPYENSTEVDFMRYIKDFVFEKDAFKRTENSEKFAKDMQQRYGEQWLTRLSAFAIKEVGVDAAILITAAYNPGLASRLFPGREAELAVRFKAAINRAVLVGVGGGTIQSALNAMSNQPLNIMAESYERVIAALIGEGVAKAVSLPIRAGATAIKGVIEAGWTTFRKNASEFLAERAGLPLYKTGVPTAANDVTRPLTPIEQAVREASVYNMSQEYRRMQKDAATVVASAPDKEMSALRQQMIKLTGIKDSEFDMVVGLAPELYATYSKVGKPVIRVKAESRPVAAEGAPTFTETPSITATNLGEGTTGAMLVDKVAVGEAMGFRVMGAVTQRQQTVDDIWFSTFGPGEFKFRPTPTADKDPTFAQNNTFKTWFADPRGAFSRWKGTVNDVIDSYRAAEGWAKTFDRAVDAANSGLNRKSVGKVMSVLEKGADEQKLYSTGELRSLGLNGKEIDSYYAHRKIYDIAHIALDASFTRELNQKGYKTFVENNQHFIVKVTTEGLTKEQIADGLVRIKELPGRTTNQVLVPKLTGPGKKSETVVSKIDVNNLDKIVPKSSLQDITSAIPVEVGYIPINYTNPRWHVSFIDADRGTIDRLVASPTLRGATQAMKELEARHMQSLDAKFAAGEITPTQYDRAKKTQIFSTFSWNERAKTGSSAITKFGLNLLDIADDATIANINKVLSESGFSMDASALRATISGVNNVTRGRRHIGPRTQRLKDQNLNEAPTAPAEEAQKEYLEAIAYRLGYGDTRNFVESKFIELYGSKGHKVLKDNSFNSEIIGNTPAAKEAAAIRDYFRRSLSFRTEWENGFENYYNSLIESMTKRGGKTGSAAGVLMDRLPWMVPGHPEMIKASRNVVAHAKLFAGNPSQLFVQSIPGVVDLVSRQINTPQHLMAGYADTMKAIGGLVAEKSGARPSKEVAQLLNFMRNSGVNADVMSSDFQILSSKDTMSWSRLAELHGVVKGTAKGVWQDSLGAIGRGVKKYGPIPFQTAESFQRAFAMYATRREFIEAARKGTLNGLDGKPFKGAIDGPEFTRLVADKASMTFLEMSRASQVKALSGPGSVVFQFWQILPKAIHSFSPASTLSGAEKMRILSGRIAILGTPTIPMLYDLFNSIDWAYYTMTGSKPTNRKVVTDWLKDKGDYVLSAGDAFFANMGTDRAQVTKVFNKLNSGAIKELTDGEIDLAHRMGQARFFGDMLEQSPLEMMLPIWHVINDSIDASIGEQGLGNLLVKLYDGTASGADFGDTLNEWGQAVSSIGYISNYLRNNVPETYRHDFRQFDSSEAPTMVTGRGRASGVLTTPLRNSLQLLGITPGPLVDELYIRRIENEYRTSIRNYIDEQKKRITDVQSPQKRTEIFSNTLAELVEVDKLVKEKGLYGALPSSRGKLYNEYWIQSVASEINNALISSRLKFQRSNPQ